MVAPGRPVRYRRSVPVTPMSTAKSLHRLLAIEKQLRLVEQPKRSGSAAGGCWNERSSSLEIQPAGLVWGYHWLR
jgi:hypothetical protein